MTKTRTDRGVQPPVVQAVDEAAAELGVIRHYMPGADAFDRGMVVARSLDADSSLFSPDWESYNGRLMLSLREAAALLLELNPVHPGTDLSWLSAFERYTAQDVRAHLTRYRELVELAAAEIARGKLAGSADKGAQASRVGLIAFADWARQHGAIEPVKFQALYRRGTPDLPTPRPKKSAQQDEWVLDWLRKGGYDPRALPAKGRGEGGVRAVMAADAPLRAPQLFPSKKSAQNAWDRLVQQREIAPAR